MEFAAGWGDGLSFRTVPELRDHPIPSHIFAEFIIGRRFAPTRWLNVSPPPPPGEGEESMAMAARSYSAAFAVMPGRYCTAGCGALSRARPAPNNFSRNVPGW
jgi:hypothetical protein